MPQYNADLTVMILKPDLAERSLRGRLFAEIKKSGLSVVFTGSVRFNLDAVQRFYQWDSIFYHQQLHEYLCVSDLEFLILSGKCAIIKAHEIKLRMRSEFCNGSKVKNLIHCSENHGDFLHEFGELMMAQSVTDRKKMGEIKTNNQTEAILFRRSDNRIEYLMLKRSAKRGGFWQPITGNVKPHETFELAAIREMEEETGITSYIRVVDTNYGYDFHDDGRDQHEHVLGIEVHPDAEVTLSHEHTEFCWASKKEALQLLRYPGNIQGLEKLSELLA